MQYGLPGANVCPRKSEAQVSSKLRIFDIAHSALKLEALRYLVSVFKQRCKFAVFVHFSLMNPEIIFHH